MDSQAQQKMEKLFSEFLLNMEHSFNAAGEDMTASFWSKIFGLGPAIAEVWDSGRCPQFKVI